MTCSSGIFILTLTDWVHVRGRLSHVAADIHLFIAGAVERRGARTVEQLGISILFLDVRNPQPVSVGVASYFPTGLIFRVAAM